MAGEAVVDRLCPFREALPVGVLIAFIFYVRRFFDPIRNLSDQFNTLQGAMAAGERIFGVLDEDEALPEAREPYSPEVAGRPFEGHIVFEDVWFHDLQWGGLVSSDAWNGDLVQPGRVEVRDALFESVSGVSVWSFGGDMHTERVVIRDALLNPNGNHRISPQLQGIAIFLFQRLTVIL